MDAGPHRRSRVRAAVWSRPELVRRRRWQLTLRIPRAADGAKLHVLGVRPNITEMGEVLRELHDACDAVSAATPPRSP